MLSPILSKRPLHIVTNKSKQLVTGWHGRAVGFSKQREDNGTFRSFDRDCVWRNSKILILRCSYSANFLLAVQQ
jgi:hypothetical protein